MKTNENGFFTFEGLTILLAIIGIVCLALAIFGGKIDGLNQEWFWTLCQTGAEWACQMH